MRAIANFVETGGAWKTKTKELVQLTGIQRIPHPACPRLPPRERSWRTWAADMMIRANVHTA